MSTALHLAKAEDLDRIDALAAAFQSEEGLQGPDETRRTALAALLEGSPHGAVYLIGPVRAPLGYIVITFGWSIELGGMDAFLDELYIRPAVRGRGIAGSVLHTLPKALAGAGVKAIHLEVDTENETAKRLYLRSGFSPRSRYMLMTKQL